MNLLNHTTDMKTTFRILVALALITTVITGCKPKPSTPQTDIYKGEELKDKIVIIIDSIPDMKEIKITENTKSMSRTMASYINDSYELITIPYPEVFGKADTIEITTS